MTNKEAKHQVFMEAHARWLANQEKHYGYNENVGKYQDDLNEMVWADWEFTEAHEKLWSDYIRYFEEGISPYKAKLSKKEIERRLERKWTTWFRPSSNATRKRPTRKQYPKACGPF
ncbi:hypothetical protein [Allobaculum sp. Allo2]|uniref:hypothetical protein n=1 Tax=Allobaculum sp. Allo2 TaxID=2853432 RepID=UPI001F602483|nr:hypothetical protein [Allobaculum sp. Allo2]UNT94253.1 hypothetical protein KWG61_06535 [Allobaculum sp. Allo2]